MRTVEMFLWRVPASGHLKAYTTNYLLDAAEAADRYPGATPAPGTRVVRQMPETEQEMRKAQYGMQSAGHDSVQPPRK